MGYSLSWVAVRADTKAVYTALNLQPTGAREEVPESPYCATQLSDGRTVVVFDHADIADGPQLKRLSHLGETIYCFVEEHVMESIVSGWRSGTRLWMVAHDGQQGLNHLFVDGQVPPAFAVIRDRFLADQVAETLNNVDHLFDIPVELARELGGFRHDENFQSADKEPFEVLESIKKKKWWSLS